MPLDCGVLNKCREDLADVRIVTSEGELPPIAVIPADPPVKSRDVPTKVYRMQRRAGRWTEIWVDKSDKVLTEGVTIRTNARDFFRRVEIRGADNPSDLFVIRLDGLILDTTGPVPLRALRIDHPANNFQYLCLRILDDEPPIHVESIRCSLPTPKPILSRPAAVRIVENRPGADGRSWVVLADLGENRYPVFRVTVATRETNFIKRAEVGFGNSPGRKDWRTVFKGAFYRVERGEARKQRLRAEFPPQTDRYMTLRLSGSPDRPVTVESFDALSRIPVVLFRREPGKSYALVYGNAASGPPAGPVLRPGRDVETILAASAGVRLGPEQKSVVRKKPAPTPSPAKPKTTIPWITVGIGMLTAGLLALVGFTLRARSRRRAQRRRASRIFDVR